MANKINVGLVGLGRIAGHHFKAIKKVNNFKIVAASDLNHEKRDNFFRKHKIKTFKHYSEMLDIQKNIDIVVIMTPSGMHFEHAYKILNKYKDNLDTIRLKIDEQNINYYIDYIINSLFEANKYFNDQEPWKKKDDQKRLNTILYTTLEIIRKISFL